MKRKIAVALVALLLFAGLSGYAYAANTNLIYYSKNCSPGTYTTVSNPAEKTNNSEVYVYLGSAASANTAYVRIMGSNGSISGAVNCTIYNDVLTDHVTIQTGTIYGIESVVYGRQLSHAAVSLMTYSGGTLIGFWSPDTDQDYTVPMA